MIERYRGREDFGSAAHEVTRIRVGLYALANHIVIQPSRETYTERRNRDEGLGFAL